MTESYVRKIRQTYDEASQNWFDTYETLGLEGGVIMVDVPREEQAPEAIRRLLLRQGADLPSRSESCEAIKAAVIEDAPIVRRAAQVGWRDDGSAFVAHHEVFGGDNAGSLIPPKMGTMSVAPLPANGTLAGWLEVIKHARFSTIMIASLCAVFAAALIRPMRRQSFGLVIVAPSRSGKTTAQLVSASALGFARGDMMPSLNATPAGILAAACTFSDHMMPIDEVGSAKGRKSDVYYTLREATYSLLNGHDTIRHPTWTGAGATRQTFRVIPILSSEHSPEVWATRNGEFRDEGETARLIGVPAVYRGKWTIFDRAPKGLGGAALKLWQEETFRKLITGVSAEHGTAFPHFMRDLIDNLEVRIVKAEHLQQLFVERLRPSARSPVALDIVGKFGLLFAGGVLASKAGALPFSSNQIGEAIRVACRAALKALPDPARDLADDLTQLTGHLQSGAIVEQASMTRKTRRLMGQANGYRQKKEGGTEFVLRSRSFTSWFSNEARVRQVLYWIDEKGFLKHSRSPSQARSNAWAQQQVTWPDGTRQRSIVIYLPNGYGDLNV